MATGGYYRSDGIQSSGTALKRDGNTEIYNSSGKIYPREQTVSFEITPDTYGGFYLSTLRQNYDSDEPRRCLGKKWNLGCWKCKTRILL